MERITCSVRTWCVNATWTLSDIHVVIPCLVNMLWSLVFPLLAAYFDLALILLCSNAQNRWAIKLHAGVPESELLEFNYTKSSFHISLAIKDQMQEMIVQPQGQYARKLNGWQWSNPKMFGPLLYRLRKEFYYLVIAVISNTILFNRKFTCLLPVQKQSCLLHIPAGAFCLCCEEMMHCC